MALNRLNHRLNSDFSQGAADLKIYVSIHARKQTRQPPLACRWPALRPCHLAATDCMETEAAIMDMARA